MRHLTIIILMLTVLILLIGGLVHGRIPGDLNGDHIVDMKDMAILVADWLRVAIPHGDNLTIAAHGVSDVHGEVVACEFYLDTDGIDTLDPNTDLLIGTDANDVGGWSLVVAADTQPLGINLYHCRCMDDSYNWSLPVSTLGEIVSE